MTSQFDTGFLYFALGWLVSSVFRVVLDFINHQPGPPPDMFA